MLFIIAATNVTLEPEWAAILFGSFLTGVPLMFGGLAWFVKITQKAANAESSKEISAEFRKELGELEQRLDEKISGAVRDASAAKYNSEATLRNQVSWMEGAHAIASDRIHRPDDSENRAS